MAIRPVCDKCNMELSEFGALLFGPPMGNITKKHHLCVDCYKKIVSELKNK